MYRLSKRTVMEMIIFSLGGHGWSCWTCKDSAEHDRPSPQWSRLIISETVRLLDLHNGNARMFHLFMGHLVHSATKTKPSKTTVLYRELTRQRACVSECADLRVGETSEQRDDVVHHVLVVDDTVLTLVHQSMNEVAEVRLELLVRWTGHYQRIVTAVLFTSHNT